MFMANTPWEDGIRSDALWTCATRSLLHLEIGSMMDHIISFLWWGQMEWHKEATFVECFVEIPRGIRSYQNARCTLTILALSKFKQCIQCALMDQRFTRQADCEIMHRLLAPPPTNKCRVLHDMTSVINDHQPL